MLVILAQRPWHGYALRREVERCWGLKLTDRAVYRNLAALEEQGLVRSSWSLPDTGRAQRVFEVTDAGREAVPAARATVDAVRLWAEAWIERAEALTGTPGAVPPPERGPDAPYRRPRPGWRPALAVAAP
jgi:DNA-binding PadR family transcriptional regulator